MLDLTSNSTQKVFGDLIGISQKSVSDLISRDVLVTGDSVGSWLRAYCSHLREQAAARVGDLDLAGERAALARAQRVRIEMQNEQTRRELAPVAELELALTQIGRKVASSLEPITANVKRLSKNLTVADIETLAMEVVKAQHIAMTAKLDVGDPDGLNDDLGQDVGMAE